MKQNVIENKNERTERLAHMLALQDFGCYREHMNISKDESRKRHKQSVYWMVQNADEIS